MLGQVHARLADTASCEDGRAPAAKHTTPCRRCCSHGATADSSRASQSDMPHRQTPQKRTKPLHNTTLCVCSNTRKDKPDLLSLPLEQYLRYRHTTRRLRSHKGHGKKTKEQQPPTYSSNSSTRCLPQHQQQQPTHTHSAAQQIANTAPCAQHLNTTMLFCCRLPQGQQVH